MECISADDIVAASSGSRPSSVVPNNTLSRGAQRRVMYASTGVMKALVLQYTRAVFNSLGEAVLLPLAVVIEGRRRRVRLLLVGQVEGSDVLQDRLRR